MANKKDGSLLKGYWWFLIMGLAFLAAALGLVFTGFFLPGLAGLFFSLAVFLVALGVLSLVVAGQKRRRHDEALEAMRQDIKGKAESKKERTRSLHELVVAKELLDSGVITEDEFKQVKRQCGFGLNETKRGEKSDE